MSVPYYIRREIDDVISVNSIVTVYHLNIQSENGQGDIHDFPEICYVEEGFLPTATGDVPVTLDAGQIIIYAPDTYHAPSKNTRAAPLFATLGIVSFVSQSTSLEALYNRPITLTHSQRELYSDIITAGLSLFGSKNGGGHIGHLPKSEANNRELQRMKNLLEVFLLDIYSHSGHSHSTPVGSNKEKLKRDQMAEVTEYLLKRIDKTLTLEEISRELGFSVSKLRRLVFDQMGCGPITYFIELKIEEAKRLIRSSPMNITEISEYLGFSSIHYFSKQFKSKTGKSPTAYAKTIDKR